MFGSEEEEDTYSDMVFSVGPAWGLGCSRMGRATLPVSLLKGRERTQATGF